MPPAHIPYLPHYSKTSVIYISCLVCCCAALASLPFLKTNISIRSAALIRPATETSMIRSPVNGRLKESFVAENKAVNKGEVLFVVESEVMKEKEKLLTAKTEEAKRFIADYQFLLSPATSERGGRANLETPLLQQSLLSYQQKLFDATTRHNKAKADFARSQKRAYCYPSLTACRIKKF